MLIGYIWIKLTEPVNPIITSVTHSTTRHSYRLLISHINITAPTICNAWRKKMLHGEKVPLEAAISDKA